MIPLESPADRAYILLNAAGLYEVGVVALAIAGVAVHPECQTKDEIMLTKAFLKAPPFSACARCGRGWVGGAR